MLMWFVACEASAFGFMVLVLTQAARMSFFFLFITRKQELTFVGQDTFKYSELVHSCIVTYKSRELPAVWAASVSYGTHRRKSDSEFIIFCSSYYSMLPSWSLWCRMLFTGRDRMIRLYDVY